MHSGFPIEAKQFSLFINKKPARGRVSLLYIIKFKAYPPRGFHRLELPELFSRYWTYSSGERADFVFGYGINRQADLMERHARARIHSRTVVGESTSARVHTERWQQHARISR